MATIHLLPTPSDGLGGTAGSVVTLTRVLADSIDLGPRTAPIDATARAPEQVLIVLQQEVEPVLRPLRDGNPIRPTIETLLDRFTREVRHLIVVACSPPQ